MRSVPILLWTLVVATACQQGVPPVKIAMTLDDTTEMVIGDYQVIEVLFFGPHHDLYRDNYVSVTQRGISWSTNQQGLLAVDPYGRIEALGEGMVTLKVTSKVRPEIFDRKVIRVVSQPSESYNDRKTPVHYRGRPAQAFTNRQRLVDRFSLAEIEASHEMPVLVKHLATRDHAMEGNFEQVSDEGILWQIVPFADGSDHRYVIRTDFELPDSSRDRVQHFMGNRYLPGDGKSPRHIVDDGDHGIWIVAEQGQQPLVTHLRMVELDYRGKAIMMSQRTQDDAQRLGLTSGAYWVDSSWVPEISDNDGLWTSMYGAGELMRYAVTNDPQEKGMARRSALKALKAVLMLAHISGRDSVIVTKIRHLSNVVTSNGNQLSSTYLKAGAVKALDTYPGNPATKIGYFGIDAGRTIKGRQIGGTCRFTLQPIHTGDWLIQGPAATTTRSLQGFIARTFAIPEVENHIPYQSGLFLQRNANDHGGQLVKSGANRLYDFSIDSHPILEIGNLPVPEILADVLTWQGRRFQAKDVVYKADTSTDEIIGHLFIYKLAFDILQEAGMPDLVALIRRTVINLAEHFLENGYQLVDATGQGTTWGKTTRDYFISDYTMGDNTLNSSILLCVFKLAHYMTGWHKWHAQYQWLARSTAYDYARLAGEYWQEWLWIGKNDDYEVDRGIYRLRGQPSEAEQTRHAMYSLNYSDQEMAMLVYYLLIQMEDDPELLAAYRKALDAWWNGIRQSENPLWYYIYQLAYPDQEIKGSSGELLIHTASWALSRQPIDMIQYQAYFDGARSDVLKDYTFSIDPSKVIGKRTSQTDAQLASDSTNFVLDPDYDPHQIYGIKVLPADERALNKMNNTTFTNISGARPSFMQPSTVYTLPYWFGIYHHMLEYND